VIRAIRQLVGLLRETRRIRRATLPWQELESEAVRQGCSPADIFFDRAGRTLGIPDVERDEKALSWPKDA
jgi:hypothetical protein